jgi:hypothetical protein
MERVQKITESFDREVVFIDRMSAHMWRRWKYLYHHAATFRSSTMNRVTIQPNTATIK